VGNRWVVHPDRTRWRPGNLGLRESGEYAVEVLTELGYVMALVVMTGASRKSWGEKGTAIVVETVLNAEWG
jgi:hypothetical protein